MKNFFIYLLFSLAVLHSKEEELFCYFSPPSDWECVDPSTLSSLVHVGFVGKGKKLFRPSLNLAIEEVDCGMKAYLKAVKEIHESHPNTKWRDMGPFKSKGGKAHLTEINRKTQWGDVRMLQAILIRDSKAFILTGAVLREEFSDHFKSLLKSMKSMNITDNLISSVDNSSLKMKLEKACSTLQSGESTLEEFHKLIADDYKNMGMHWQIIMAKYASEHYFQAKKPSIKEEPEG